MTDDQIILAAVGDIEVRPTGMVPESAGWDADGAKAFGYPTVWINRGNLPVEQLGTTPDLIGTSMADLAAFVGA